MFTEDFMYHYKHPNNRGSLSDFDVEVIEKNPVCGDILKLQAKIKDDTFTDIAFDGDACSVSIVSASILTDFVKGKRLSDITITRDELIANVSPDLTTSRVKCAELPLLALKNLIKKYAESKR